MNKSFLVAIVTASLLIQLQPQEKQSAAKTFLETKEKSGLEAALLWLDCLDTEKARQYFCDEKEFLNIGKEMKSFGKDEAIRCLQRAIKISPKNGSAHGQLKMIDFLLEDTRYETREKRRTS